MILDADLRNYTELRSDPESLAQAILSMNMRDFTELALNDPSQMIAVGDSFFFTAGTGTAKTLWTSDGTFAGTHVVPLPAGLSGVDTLLKISDDLLAVSDGLESLGMYFYSLGTQTWSSCIGLGSAKYLKQVLEVDKYKYVVTLDATAYKLSVVNGSSLTLIDSWTTANNVTLYPTGQTMVVEVNTNLTTSLAYLDEDRLIEFDSFSGANVGNLLACNGHLVYTTTNGIEGKLWTYAPGSSPVQVGAGGAELYNVHGLTAVGGRLYAFGEIVDGQNISSVLFRFTPGDVSISDSLRFGSSAYSGDRAPEIVYCHDSEEMYLLYGMTEGEEDLTAVYYLPLSEEINPDAQLDFTSYAYGWIGLGGYLTEYDYGAVFMEANDTLAGQGTLRLARSDVGVISLGRIGVPSSLDQFQIVSTGKQVILTPEVRLQQKVYTIADRQLVDLATAPYVDANVTVEVIAAESDGGACWQDVSLPALASLSQTFRIYGSGTDVQLDVTSLLRQAMEAGLRRVAFRVSTGASVELRVYDDSQTPVTLQARQISGVLLDVYDAQGGLLAQDVTGVDMRNLPAGEYYLRVHRPTEAAEYACSYQIEIDAPFRSQAWESTDRDRLYGQDGDDTLVGNGGADFLYGQSGDDSFVGEPFEYRDLAAGENSRQADEADLITNSSAGVLDPLVNDQFTYDFVVRRVGDALGIPYVSTPSGARFSVPVHSSQLKALTYLDLSGIPTLLNLNGLEYATNLLRLDLRGSVIDSTTLLSPLASHLAVTPEGQPDVPDAGHFLGLTSLSELYLDAATERTAGTFETILDALLPLNSVQVLSAPGLGLSSIQMLDGMTGLRYLDLTGNRIYSIDPLADAVKSGNLQVALLAGNQILQAGPLLTAYIADDSDGGAATGLPTNFIAPGWWRTTGSGDFAYDDSYLDGYHYYRGTGVATWTLDDLPVGQYDIYATWHANEGQASNALYRVNMDADDPDAIISSVTVDQRIAPTGLSQDGQDWQKLGTFTKSADGSVTVSLVATGADGTVVADAVMIVTAGWIGGGLRVVDLTGNPLDQTSVFTDLPQLEQQIDLHQPGYTDVRYDLQQQTLETYSYRLSVSSGGTKTSGISYLADNEVTGYVFATTRQGQDSLWRLDPVDDAYEQGRSLVNVAGMTIGGVGVQELLSLQYARNGDIVAGVSMEDGTWRILRLNGNTGALVASVAANGTPYDLGASTSLSTPYAVEYSAGHVYWQSTSLQGAVSSANLGVTLDTASLHISANSMYAFIGDGNEIWSIAFTDGTVKQLISASDLTDPTRGQGWIVDFAVEDLYSMAVVVKFPAGSSSVRTFSTITAHSRTAQVWPSWLVDPVSVQSMEEPDVLLFVVRDGQRIVQTDWDASDYNYIDTTASGELPYEQAFVTPARYRVGFEQPAGLGMALSYYSYGPSLLYTAQANGSYEVPMVVGDRPRVAADGSIQPGGFRSTLYHDVHVGVGAIYGKITRDYYSVENRLVFVDLDQDAAQDANEPYTYSDAEGYYSFGNLPLGVTYRVRQGDPTGQVQGIVAPAGYVSVTLSTGTPIAQNVNIDNLSYAVIGVGSGDITEGDSVRLFDDSRDYSGPVMWMVFNPDGSAVDLGSQQSNSEVYVTALHSGLYQAVLAKSIGGMAYCIDATYFHVNEALPQLADLTSRTGSQGQTISQTVTVLGDGGNDTWLLDVDWGDGTVQPYSVTYPAIAQDISHVYLTPGSYQVLVSIRQSDQPEGAVQDQKNFGVTIANVAPSVTNFFTHYEVMENQDLDLTALWSDPGLDADAPYVVGWTLRQGATVIQTLQGTTVRLNVPLAGDYDIWAQVTDNHGAASLNRKIGTLTVVNPPPTVELEVVGSEDGTWLETSPIWFRAQVTNLDPGEVYYEWDFNYDGLNFDFEGSSPAVQKVFEQDGTFTVAVRVTAYQAGQTTSAIQTTQVTLADVPPELSVFMYGGYGDGYKEGGHVSGEVSVQDVQGDLENYLVSWAAYMNGVSSPFAEGQTSWIDITLPEDGECEVRFAVHATGGDIILSDSRVLSVGNADPTIWLDGYSGTFSEGQPLEFTAWINDESQSPDEGLWWHIDWGDGLSEGGPVGDGSGTGWNPAELPLSHLYVDGVYTFTLTAGDADGGLVTIMQEVVVENVLPTLQDMAAELAGSEWQSIDFTGKVMDTPGEPLRVRVDFGDGTVLPALMTYHGGPDAYWSFGVSHRYHIAGIYQASIAAYDGNLASPSATANVNVTVTSSDPVPPSVVQSSVNGGQANRSSVRRVTVGFSEDVGGSLSASDFQLTNLDTLVDVDSANMLLVYDNQTFTAELTFPGLAGGTLADGNYRLMLSASTVSDLAGNPMADEFVLLLHRLAGDFDGDAAVTAADIDFLTANMGPGGDYDLNGDGTADQRDVTYLVTTILDTGYGDANLDGLVDYSDFQTMLDHWQLPATWATGDWDGDGQCNFGDFQVLLDNWNPTGSTEPFRAGETNVAVDPAVTADGSIVVQDATAAAGQSSAGQQLSVLSGDVLDRTELLLIDRPDAAATCVVLSSSLASKLEPKLIEQETSDTTPAEIPFVPSSSSESAETSEDGPVDLLTQLVRPVLEGAD